MSTIEAEPTDDELIASIRADIHPEATFHGVTKTGSSEYLWYYLAVWTRPHQDDPSLQHLCERYYQWPKPSASDDMEPTFKTNGMARRETVELAPEPDGLRTNVLRMYARAQADAKTGGETGDPLVLG